MLANIPVKCMLADMTATPVNIAIAHSVFNIATTILLMPFSKYLLRLTEPLAGGKKRELDVTEDVPFLDERLLQSPSVAIRECNNASSKMLGLSRENLYLAGDLFEQYS